VAAALQQAEAGMQVTLVEPSPSLGGECLPQTKIIDADSPYIKPDVEALRNHPNIQVITNAEVIRTESADGQYRFRIKQSTPRVDMEKCNDCKECIRVCPIHMYDDGHLSGKPEHSLLRRTYCRWQICRIPGGNP
jgi:heterodisulfide reductase subunit A